MISHTFTIGGVKHDIATNGKGLGLFVRRYKQNSQLVEFGGEYHQFVGTCFKVIPNEDIGNPKKERERIYRYFRRRFA